MKTAADYARQAARFALLAGVDADGLREECERERYAGEHAARKIGLQRRALRATVADARWFASIAAQHARRARAGGWWREEQAHAARLSAMNAARCAGYAGA